jgi:FMS-like tyrosine kinase 1
MKAEACGIMEGEAVTTVAVKMVKRNADYMHIKALASELKIMVHLGKHLNVVNLLGACTKNLTKRKLIA